jgi:translation initiation factor IF-3
LRRVRTNEQIWAREVRLIDDQGQQLGVIPRDRALQIARERELDLVEVSPDSNPVVCRIINYDKYRYQLEKKEKQQRKTSKKTELKEVRLGVRTGEHDLDFKRRKALKFLQEGRKVKIELVMRGRERAHRDLAREVLNAFLGKIQEENQVKVEQPIMGSPRGFNCVISKQ